MHRIIAWILLLLPIDIGSSALNAKLTDELLGRAGVSWEAFLPAIAWAESEHYTWAVSKRGIHHGRGVYQISEICLRHYKDENPGNDWITPKSLFNTNVARPIALWYLWKCNAAYDEVRPFYPRIYWVLSAYNQGIWGTMRDGLNWHYIERVMYGRRYMVSYISND